MTSEEIPLNACSALIPGSNCFLILCLVVKGAQILHLPLSARPYTDCVLITENHSDNFSSALKNRI
jgi:hypothetical protein